MHAPSPLPRPQFEAEVARLARLMDDEKHEAALARADMEDARTAAEKATHKVDELKGMLRATQEELEAASAKASKYESLCAEARGDAHAAQKQVVKLQEETRMLTNKVEVRR